MPYREDQPSGFGIYAVLALVFAVSFGIHLVRGLTKRRAKEEATADAFMFFVGYAIYVIPSMILAGFMSQGKRSSSFLIAALIILVCGGTWTAMTGRFQSKDMSEYAKPQPAAKLREDAFMGWLWFLTPLAVGSVLAYALIS